MLIPSPPGCRRDRTRGHGLRERLIGRLHGAELLDGAALVGMRLLAGEKERERERERFKITPA